MKHLTGLLSFFLIVSPAFAGAYKWTDAAGNVHYGDRPPPDSRVERMAKPPGSAPSGNAKPEGQEEPPSDLEEASGNSDIEAKNAALRAAIDRQNCEAARGNLAAYTAHRRIMTPQGEVVVLGDEEREAKIRQAREMIAQHCKE